jgi:hypothetical protein
VKSFCFRKMWVVEHRCIQYLLYVLRHLGHSEHAQHQVLSQAQMTCLHRMMRLMPVLVPHHWDRYHTDKTMAEAVRPSSQHGEERMKKSPTPHFRCMFQRHQLGFSSHSTASLQGSKMNSRSAVKKHNVLSHIEWRTASDI